MNRSGKNRPEVGYAHDNREFTIIMDETVLAWRVGGGRFYIDMYGLLVSGVVDEAVVASEVGGGRKERGCGWIIEGAGR